MSNPVFTYELVRSNKRQRTVTFIRFKNGKKQQRLRSVPLSVDNFNYYSTSANQQDWAYLFYEGLSFLLTDYEF